MLVLSRKQGESIEFPELNVVVRVMQLKKSKVQLGIEAPRQIKVDRSEMVAKPPLSESTSDDESMADQPLGEVGSEGESRRGESSTGADDGQMLTRRLLDDLLKLEAEVAAMAELVASKDRNLARQVAAVSIERLGALRRAVHVAERRGQARPIAEFMKARGKLLEQSTTMNGVEDACASNEWGTNSSPNTKCVRQPPSGYVAEPSLRAACHVA